MYITLNRQEKTPELGLEDPTHQNNTEWCFVFLILLSILYPEINKQN